MVISSRTPEGQPNQCPVCGSSVRIEPSLPFGDAPCPTCGHLLWFVTVGSDHYYFGPDKATGARQRVLRLVAEQLGVSREQLVAGMEVDSIDMAEFAKILTRAGADSLDIVELVMELEEEFDQ